ncbi:MAG: hypothetical protein ABW252_05365 [Polyangiales bacterium]
MRPSRLAGVTLLLSLALPHTVRAQASPCEPAPSATTTLTNAWVAPSGALWVVGAQGAIGHRTERGAWCWQTPRPGEPWTAVWGVDDDDVRFVSARGAILHRNGDAFTLERAPDDAPLDGIWGSGSRDVYAVGTTGRALHFDGAGWHAIDPEPGYQLRAVWGSDAAHVWAVGRIPTRFPLSGGGSLSGVDLVVLRRSETDWVREGSFAQPYGGGGLSAIDGTSAHDVWAVGLNQPAGAATGVSIAAHFDGARWSEVALPGGLHTGRSFRDVVAGLPGAPFGVLIATSDGALRGTPRVACPTDTTRDWARDPEAPPMLSGVARRDGVLWGVGPNLTVVRATATGWTREPL